MTEEKVSTEKVEDKVKKAEWPLNSKGLGVNSTIEAGPFFKEDVDYAEPEDNYRYVFCGACALFNNGTCAALQEPVNLIASCDLYIPMAHELELRWSAYIRRSLAAKSAEDEIVVVEQVDKYISKENGKYCVRSHKTNKNFGCYKTKAEAEKRLGQISSFKEDEDKEVTRLEIKFASMDEEKKLVYGEVLVPDEVDSHGDTITPEHVEMAAHKYSMTPMIIGDGHIKKAKAKPVETFIYNPEMLKEVKAGSWVMAVKVYDDVMWEAIKNGDYTGFSIGAFVKKLPVEETENE